MFANASQIVSGDLVEVSGNQIGTVSNIALTPSGQAQLTLNITNHAYDPLRQGTQATIRELSLSGIANRYVDLHLGAGRNADDPRRRRHPHHRHHQRGRPRRALQHAQRPDPARASRTSSRARPRRSRAPGQKMQAAFQYLNPAVAASSALFRELNRNTGDFTNFIIKTGNLVSDVATRSSDLSGLVSHLSTTTQALANQRVALGQSLQRLPGFMRLANTTFVNLRTALDDLKPLVDDSKPVAPKLQKLLVQLRPLARNSVPTLNDLSNIIQPARRRQRPHRADQARRPARRPPPSSDVNANGKSPPRRVPRVDHRAERLDSRARHRPPLRGRPDRLVRGLHPPGHDRRQRRLEPHRAGRRRRLDRERRAEPAAVVHRPDAAQHPRLRRARAASPARGRNNPTDSRACSTTGQGDRCPGSMERGALYYPESGFPCNPNQVPTGK